MQVDRIKPALKALGTKRLKLKYDESPLNFAFKFKLRRYSEARKARRRAAMDGYKAVLVERGTRVTSQWRKAGTYTRPLFSTT